MGRIGPDAIAGANQCELAPTAREEPVVAVAGEARMWEIVTTRRLMSQLGRIPLAWISGADLTSCPYDCVLPPGFSGSMLPALSLCPRTSRSSWRLRSVLSRSSRQPATPAWPFAVPSHLTGGCSARYSHTETGNECCSENCRSRANTLLDHSPDPLVRFWASSDGARSTVTANRYFYWKRAVNLLVPSDCAIAGTASNTCADGRPPLFAWCKVSPEPMSPPKTGSVADV